MDDSVKAKSFMSFHLNFLLLMQNCGRYEEAQQSLDKLVASIEALPEDLFITVPKETDK